MQVPNLSVQFRLVYAHLHFEWYPVWDAIYDVFAARPRFEQSMFPSKPLAVLGLVWLLLDPLNRAIRPGAGAASQNVSILTERDSAAQCFI